MEDQKKTDVRVGMPLQADGDNGPVMNDVDNTEEKMDGLNNNTEVSGSGSNGHVNDKQMGGYSSKNDIKTTNSIRVEIEAVAEDTNGMRHRGQTSQQKITKSDEVDLTLAFLDADDRETDIHQRLERLKSFRGSMKTRRKLRKRMIQAETPQLTGFSKWRYQRQQELNQYKKSLQEWYSGIEVWRESFKEIEGNFGSSVVTYFYFIKWLFIMNLFTTVMILSVIVLPHDIISPHNFNTTLSSLETGNTQYETQEALRCTLNYTETIKQNVDSKHVGLHIIDLFLGEGWMENTVMFMGYYFNKTGVESIEYNTPVAYLSVSAIYMFVILILMVSYAGQGMKESIVSHGDKFYLYSHKVFCGWDYSLTTEKAICLKQKNLWNEYCSDLFEAKRALEEETMRTSQKLLIYLRRAFGWLIVLAIWGGSFYVIIKSVSDWSPELLAREDVQNSAIFRLVAELLPSLILSALELTMPLVIQKIASFEEYMPETRDRITVVRIVILRLASIGFLSFSLHSKITKCDAYDCGNCAQETLCWETYVGQEFYKLVITNLFVMLGVAFFIEFPRKYLVRKFHHKWLFMQLGYQEFDIPIEVLDIVDTQIFCWIGGFFSPLIPAITVVKFLIFFYLKKLTTLKCCIPASRPYHASKSNYFFMIILMVSFGLCLIVIGFAVGRIPPSHSCGPFRIYSGNASDYFMYTSVSDAVDLTPDAVHDVLNILSNWVIYLVLVIVLCMTIFYYNAKSSANKRKVQLLEEKLKQDWMDKKFLLSQVKLQEQLSHLHTL